MNSKSSDTSEPDLGIFFFFFAAERRLNIVQLVWLRQLTFFRGRE